MILRIEKGTNTGRLYEMESSLVTIGRAIDNDIVLSDEMVSQHHAKIWKDLDGRISVTDMDSVNGTEVNGRQVKTTELRPGDRVLLGKTVLRLVGDLDETVVRPAFGKGKSGTSTIDLGFETKDKGEGEGQGRAARPSYISNRVLVVVILAVVAVGVAFAVKYPESVTQLFQSGPKTVSVHSSKSPLASGTEIYYENIIGSTVGPRGPNVRRYEIVLKGQKLSVAYDDVGDKRKFRKEKELEGTEMNKLLDSLNLGVLAKLEPREYIGNSEPGAFSQLDLQVTQAPEFFRLLVRNTRAPDALARAQENFEKQVENITGFVLLPPEEILRRASEAYDNAERYRNAEQVQLENLFKAVKLYNQVVEYLKDFDPKPAPYDDAKKKYIVADAKLTERVNEEMQRAQVHIQLRDWENAQKKFKMIMQMMDNDERDPRYESAYKEWIGKVVPNINIKPR